MQIYRFFNRSKADGFWNAQVEFKYQFGAAWVDARPGATDRHSAWVDAVGAAVANAVRKPR